MGHRLSTLYTRTGDNGNTGLADGSRVPKHSPRIQLLGDLDELNCCLGLLQTEAMPPELKACLLEIQHLLFDLGGDVSLPGRHSLDKAHSDWLEIWLDEFNQSLPPLKEFILPGGNRGAAYCHLARAVCRRTERRAVELAQQESLPANTVLFLNRLSDFLFVAARIIARQDHQDEILWQHARSIPHPSSR